MTDHGYKRGGKLYWSLILSLLSTIESTNDVWKWTEREILSGERKSAVGEKIRCDTGTECLSCEVPTRLTDLDAVIK